MVSMALHNITLNLLLPSFPAIPLCKHLSHITPKVSQFLPYSVLPCVYTAVLLAVSSTFLLLQLVEFLHVLQDPCQWYYSCEVKTWNNRPYYNYSCCVMWIFMLFDYLKI